jgi:hypothetical protein
VTNAFRAFVFKSMLSESLGSITPRGSEAAIYRVSSPPAS